MQECGGRRPRLARDVHCLVQRTGNRDVRPAPVHSPHVAEDATDGHEGADRGWRERVMQLDGERLVGMEERAQVMFRGIGLARIVAIAHAEQCASGRIDAFGRNPHVDVAHPAAIGPRGAFDDERGSLQPQRLDAHGIERAARARDLRGRLAAPQAPLRMELAQRLERIDGHRVAKAVLIQGGIHGNQQAVPACEIDDRGPIDTARHRRDDLRARGKRRHQPAKPREVAERPEAAQEIVRSAASASRRFE